MALLALSSFAISGSFNSVKEKTNLVFKITEEFSRLKHDITSPGIMWASSSLLSVELA